MDVLHSLIIGEGEKDLLILHGFLGMGDNWKTHAKHWATQGWRVHLIDQRNHGRSFWSDDFNYDFMAEDLLKYFDAHKIAEATLLGHSMGGKVAMQFACTNPEKVTQLIVADIAPKAYPPHHQQILNGLAALNFSQITSRKEADQTLSNFIKEAGIRQFLLKNIYRVTPTQLGLRINIAVLKNASDQIGTSLSQEMQYPGKTLFLKGEHSGYIEAGDELLLQHHFPQNTLVTIEKAGHWLHAENLMAFGQAIANWW
ncbi:MAG: alpha/beta fold hydrolase [Flavobacteriaceae bacterium]|nr:alpha/beta fold hydrolase [Flavobacteriaceae bacterium]